MDTQTSEKNCHQIVSAAIAGMIRRSLRAEAFREKCFNLLQVTNSSDAELELERRLKQCISRSPQSESTCLTPQDVHSNYVPQAKRRCIQVDIPKASNSLELNATTDSENSEEINNSSSDMNKTSLERKKNSNTQKNLITNDILELKNSLEWDSTQIKNCSSQELLQYDYTLLRNVKSSKTIHNEISNWFHSDSQEFEW